MFYQSTCASIPCGQKGDDNSLQFEPASKGGFIQPKPNITKSRKILKHPRKSREMLGNPNKSQKLKELLKNPRKS